MRVNITAWCRYKENYSLPINEDYLKSLNKWVHDRYPYVEFEDITFEDIYAIFGDGEWNNKLDIRLDVWCTLSECIEKCVREDVWDFYENNEYCYMEGYDIAIGFDSSEEKARFEDIEK